MAKKSEIKNPQSEMGGDHRTDRDVDPVLAALCELCQLMLATRRNGGTRTAHVFGVRFTESCQLSAVSDQGSGDPVAGRLLEVAKREGFRTEISQSHPATLVLSC